MKKPGDPMDMREQIILLLHSYVQGKYDFPTFCDVFSSLYYTSGGYKLFGEGDRESLDQIGAAVERFSPSSDDLRRYPKTYYSERQAREIVDNILPRLSFLGTI